MHILLMSLHVHVLQKLLLLPHLFQHAIAPVLVSITLYLMHIMYTYVIIAIAVISSLGVVVIISLIICLTIAVGCACKYKSKYTMFVNDWLLQGLPH